MAKLTHSFSQTVAALLAALVVLPPATAVPPMADYWSLRSHPDRLKPLSASRPWAAQRAVRAGEPQADYPTFRSVGAPSAPNRRTRGLLRQVAFLQDSVDAAAKAGHPRSAAAKLALSSVRDELVVDGAKPDSHVRVARVKKVVQEMLRKTKK